MRGSAKKSAGDRKDPISGRMCMHPRGEEFELKLIEKRATRLNTSLYLQEGLTEGIH